ncbi:heme peroxidase [Flagelloscypha sp. PMI_526]|nr:heme peroxidase [Flagelloscypha sp. PMI_526]
MPSRCSLLITLLLASLGSAADPDTQTMQLTWPYSPMIDYEEFFLTEGTLMQTVAAGCASRDNTTVAAQWVRAAYHDVGNADVGIGRGGLDASVRFELDRDENVGTAMTQTFHDFRLEQRPPYTGMADLLAMGVVFSYRVCGGPSIPYRAGRVDATQADSPGVPKPDQDIDTHIAIFKRQGFSQSEMIALVACGHTMGGVSALNFPSIHINNVDNMAFFHGAKEYSHNIVSGYLDGTTPDPLIRSSNDTMNSDQRIFSSDGDKTMQSLADPATFDKTCSSLLERMINIVPKGVTLSDVISPIENKVTRTRLFVSSKYEGELTFKTSIRILNPKEGLTVKLFWTDRQDPKTCSDKGCSADVSKTSTLGTASRKRGGQVGESPLKTLFGIDKAKRFDFEVRIHAASSIAKFWFQLGDGTIIDNGGKGYVIQQDDFLWDPYRSKVVDQWPAAQALITVGVKTSLKDKVTAYINHVDNNSAPSPTFVSIVKTNISMSPSADIPPSSGYTFFSVNTTQGDDMLAFSVFGTVDGQARSWENLELADILPASSLGLGTKAASTSKSASQASETSNRATRMRGDNIVGIGLFVSVVVGILSVAFGGCGLL